MTGMTWVAIWHGTDEDLFKLQIAVGHNCTCPVPTAENPQPQLCPAHRMLLEQTSLDHLVFAAKQRPRYVANEFKPAKHY